MKYLTLIFSIARIAGWSGNKAIKLKKKSHPSHIYNYLDLDTTKLNYFKSDYVPVYSDIYFQDGTRRLQLTTTIRIRNTSIVDSTLLLSPLESIEFVVEKIEDLGG